MILLKGNRFVILLLAILLAYSCKGEEGKELVVVEDKKDSAVVDEIIIPEEIVKESEWSRASNRIELINVIETAEQEGLLSSDYFLKEIKEFESKFNTLDVASKNKYYKLLTQSFKRYYKHMYFGKVDFSKVYTDWSLPKAPIRVDTLINYALTNNKVETILRSAGPKTSDYQMLKDALQRFDKLVGKDGKAIDLNDNLYLMSEHPQVINIKKKLLKWGGTAKMDTTSTEYNQAMAIVIKNFQEEHCIKPDGIINYETVKALNMTMLDRKKQIIANLERWRWFPRDLGREYLLINIPEYQLYYYRDNKLIRKHKVVVGKTERKTPILSSKISYIVLNPTWTVPETILKEDYFPEMEKDREFLLKKGIIIYDQKQKEVNPKDWNPKRAMSYKYIQGPSEDNVLGQVKFIFSNTHFVYLHDTNQKYYFDKVKRNLSSGCIRVEKPLDLAMDLSTKLMNYHLENEASKKSTALKNFNTDMETKMHVLYYTAWSEKKEMRYRPDVYEFDNALYDLLQKPAID